VVAMRIVSGILVAWILFHLISSLWAIACARSGHN